MKIAFDAAYPPATVPAGATTACIYAGGDTPNPIADPRTVSVYGQVRYWLPLWVRSDPTPTLGATDAAGMVAWLRRNGAQLGAATALDLETAVTRSYVTGYVAGMHAAGWRVLPYGSRSTLFENPRGDGDFLADPTWRPGKAMPAGVVAVQWKYTGGYDLSAIADTVPLWKANPPQASSAPTTTPTTTPTGTPTPTGTARMLPVSVDVGPNGAGFTLTNIAWTRCLAATLQGSDPSVDGTYWLGEAHVQERTGLVLVSVTRAMPIGPRLVFLAVTP